MEWKGCGILCMGYVPASGNQHRARSYRSAPASLSRSGGSGEDPEACTQAQGVPRQAESGRQGHLYNG